MRRRSKTYLIGLGLLTAACGPDGGRRPELHSNAEWTAPEVVDSDGVRLVSNTAPRNLLTGDQAEAPVDGTWLMFWGDQRVARDAAGIQYAANSEAHEIFMFDAELTFLGALAPQGADGGRVQRPEMVAAGADGRLAAFEADGGVTIFDRWGREFRRIDAPFDYAVGDWGPDAQLTLARSPFSIAFAFEPGEPPLLYALDPADPDAARGFGEARAAAQPVYVHAANAGSVAVDGAGHIYYAALGRPEVQKYAADGALLWVSRRPVAFETPEPRLVPNPDGPPHLALATVQKANAIGPDGLLYIRAAADAGATRDRLDVLDPASGDWLRSAPLDTGTAVLVGIEGAVWEIRKEALLEGRTGERRELSSFALETFDGDSLALEDLRGKVALISFWASWCGPCREELPALDSLSNAIEREDFVAVGINEDVNEEDGRAFAEELGLEMPMLLGRGRMRGRYHYSGLPYSVLVDREGRIVREYYGFGGRAHFETEVAGRVWVELGEGAGAPAIVHDHGHGPTREVKDGALDELARYLAEARSSAPATGADVPDEHWEKVLDGLALVDREVNGFMEKFPGTFELIQLMTLKTQLYVDVDRLPDSSDPAEFVTAWAKHLSSIEYLLDAYRNLHARAAGARH